MARKTGMDGISRREFIAGAAVLAGPLILPMPAMASVEPGKSGGGNKVNIDHFVADCIEAAKETDPQGAIKEVLARAMSAPRAMLTALGEPREAGINVLHRSETLTMFNATWTPRMNLMPHNHLMWALIGIYTGREDNILWRKTPENIEAFGARALFEGDVAALPADVIHSVTNPLLRFTGGVHIYGGDFFNTTRSQWDPETRAEEPSDGAVIRELFKQENERMQGKSAG